VLRASSSCCLHGWSGWGKGELGSVRSLQGAGLQGRVGGEVGAGVTGLVLEVQGKGVQGGRITVANRWYRTKHTGGDVAAAGACLPGWLRKQVQQVCYARRRTQPNHLPPLLPPTATHLSMAALPSAVSLADLSSSRRALSLSACCAAISSLTEAMEDCRRAMVVVTSSRPARFAMTCRGRG
jgi:hypothetical protein